MEELEEYSDKKEENTFDLKAEIFKYLTHWKWLVLCFLLGGLIAYMYNRYTIPVYRSSATLMIVNDQDNQALNAMPGGGAAFFSLESNNIQNQVETLRSKQLVGSVVDELDHNIAYFIEGNVIALEAYKASPITLQFITPDSIVNQLSKSLNITPVSDTGYRLFEESSGYSKIHEIGEVVNLNGLEFTVLPRLGQPQNSFSNSSTINVKLYPLEYAVNYYIALLDIKQKGEAKDLLSISLIQESKNRSEDFLNRLMVRFNEEGIKNKQEVAENTTAFIQERLEIITQELDSVEGGMAQFKQQNRIMDVGSGAQTFQSKFSLAEQEIFNLETQLVLIKSVQELLQKQANYELLPSDVGISESSISGLVNSYNSLVMQRNTYLTNSTPQHPAVVKISDQLNKLRGNLFDNINSTINSINIQLSELDQREKRAQGNFSTFPGLEKGIRSIERQQQIKEQLYLLLLQRREEAAISFAATASVSRIIDKAYTANSPVAPDPLLILIGGFFVGLLIPILIIFVKNFLDTKVHHKGDLQPLIKHVPFLGEIPRIKIDQSEIIQINDRSPLAESFRILRTNLAYILHNKNKDRGEVIFVTSTIKGEGKTFISYNLGRTLASTNKKVILIGADIRNPKLHRYGHVPGQDKGLSDYLYNYEIKESEIISASNDDDIKVDLVLSGAIPPNPAELFMSERMEQLLKYLSQQYDFVIVDTAPTMIVTDTLLISTLADTTLYVTRAEYTEKKLLSFPKELKEQGKLKGLAVVLNDVDYSKFSYGAKYGYSYGYGYGYGADVESKWKRIFKNPFKKD